MFFFLWIYFLLYTLTLKNIDQITIINGRNIRNGGEIIMDLTFFQEALTIIGNYGFPLILAIYLLLRFEARIQELTDSINKLRETMIDKK